jgi:hypothetical protein
MSSANQTFRGPHLASGMLASDLWRTTIKMTDEERLAQVKWFAALMDDQFRVPGTSLRFGWEPILGLFPGIGDVLTSALSLLIVQHAWQTGASKLTLARMIGNVVADFAIGAVPILGNLFDFVWRANRKNARLLEQHLARAKQTPLVRASTRNRLSQSSPSSH